jgi:hypothetical protein
MSLLHLLILTLAILTLVILPLIISFTRSLKFSRSVAPTGKISHLLIINELIPPMKDNEVVYEMQVPWQSFDLNFGCSRDSLYGVERFSLLWCQRREVRGTWMCGGAKESGGTEVDYYMRIMVKEDGAAVKLGSLLLG